MAIVLRQHGCSGADRYSALEEELTTFRKPSTNSPSASWLNLVERCFGLITPQAIRRGSFDSVACLEQAITRFLANWNENAKPFRWTKSAHRIKRSIRNAALIYGT